MTKKTASTEFISLFFLNLKVKVNSIIEYLSVIFNYYSNPTFLKIDTYLIFSYIFSNPFKISKRFLLQRGDQDPYTYGETPLRALDRIADECGFLPHDVVFELGCGRGRTCFWLNQFIGCAVVGIDYVPEFIHRADQIKQKFQIHKVQFRVEDFLHSDLTGATVIYLYGTCLPASLIESLITRFKSLPQGTKIVTVSYSLSDYTADPLFNVVKVFPARFTWGVADVYLQVKR